MRYLLFLSALLCFTRMEAQNESSLSLHYHAFNIFHSGLELGYDAPLLKLESINKKEQKRWYQLYLGPSLGVYNFRGNHTGITLGSDLGLKTIGHNGFEVEIFGGAHYLRTINANQTFELNNNGDFEEVKAAGQHYYQWRLGIGFGKNFLPKGHPFSVNVKVGASQTPPQPSPSITPNIWVGTNYYFNQ
ncbi:MAG: hypothetical protein AAGG68_02530 [Bacteroidota bacterium]